MSNTPNLGTEKLEVGQAQKETTINQAFNEIDAAFAGKLALSVAGSSNVTLTRAQALNSYYVFTGVLTGNIQVIWPASGGTARLLNIYNATTGAFTLTAVVAGGSGVAVTQTERRTFVIDGTAIAPMNTTAGGTYTQVGAAWAAWTPTWTNLTVGNGTLVARYAQVDKLVICRVSLTFGSTTSISGSVNLSVPVTIATYGGTFATPLGDAAFVDQSASAGYIGVVFRNSSTEALLRGVNTAGTYATNTGAVLSATVPFTWTTLDEIKAQFLYEAA